MPSVFSQAQLGEQLTNLLGEKLEDRELQSGLAAMEIVEPPIAQMFWQATAAKPGIYLVLAGKVRLLDSGENLITTLSPGASFGELTLFPEASLQPYSARSSLNLKLSYLKLETLQALMGKYPSIRDRLFARAELWDLLMLCRQNSIGKGNTSVEDMLKALAYFSRQDLKIGTVPAKLAAETQLWVVRQGELQHTDGSRLIPGNISVIKPGNWQATQPTIAYSLKHTDWQKALQHWGQLAELIALQAPIAEKPVVDTTNTNVIAFPSQIQLQKPQKKRRAFFPSPKVRLGHLWGRISKRYPFYQQQSVSDCGAACLVMISRYWGKRLSVNRLRELANVNRDGASLKGLTAAADRVLA